MNIRIKSDRAALERFYAPKQPRQAKPKPVAKPKKVREEKPRNVRPAFQSAMRSTPWSEKEYIRINGVKFIYRFNDNDELIVIPPGVWVRRINSWNVRNGIKFCDDFKLVNLAEHMHINELIKAGAVVELPKVVRKNNCYF